MSTGAFTFDEPATLSFKLESSFGVTKDSVTVKPILYDGVFVYLSNINVEASTCTKKPFM